MHELIISDYQNCPICTRTCNREHVAIEPGSTSSIVLIYCESCNCGWESLYKRVGGVWQSAGVTLTYSSENPEKLADFLNRLEAARSVAA